VAGRVAARGAGVEDWEIGQRVVGVAFNGALAEMAVAPAALTAAIPDRIGDAAAVALLRNGQVALGALRAARFEAGETVLITAAAGGVGHLALQLARALGAERVIGAVGTPGKDQFLIGLGADAVRGYGEGDQPWDDTVSLVLDGAGHAALQRGIAALAPFGRLVSYSAAGGSVAANELRSQSRSIIGFAVANLARHQPERYAAHREQLWRLALEGRLVPAIHAQLSLDEVQHAHQLLLDRTNRGKVVLAVNQHSG
jgi:NADPH:quinone reductase-like Zn-dependent oxidoreductase